MAAACERRDETRFDKVFSVYLHGAWGSGFGIARNISEGGMYIEALEPYPLGSKMQVVFSFPNQNTEMTAVAEVVHLCFLNERPDSLARPARTGMGIRFVGFVHEEEPVRTFLPLVCVQ